MTKLKKLVFLCTALMMTASVAAFTACGGDNSDASSSSPDTSASTPAEDNSSDGTSEGTSSDDSSSTGGDETPDDEGYYKEIIADGKGSLTGTAFTDSFGTLTLTLPEAGIYGIYTEEEAVAFSAEDVTDGNEECLTNYTFEVTQAGDVTLTTYIWPWTDGEVEYTYFLYQLKELVIEETEGEAVLAANLRTPITFVAPEAGTYLIMADQDLDWYNSADKSEEGSYGASYVISAEEAGEITFYAMFKDFNYAEFDFVWEIIPIVANLTLQEGDITATLYENVYYSVSFTATEDGTYKMSVTNTEYGFFTGIYGINEDGYATWLQGDYESFFTFTANAGETVNLNVYYTGWTANYEEGPAMVDVTINVAPSTGTGEEPDPDLEYVSVNFNEGENPVEIPAGIYAMGIAYLMGDYTISWTGDATVTVDGAPVENGSVVTLMNPMFGMNNVVITPTDATAACTVVLTITAYVAPAVEMVLGANAIEVTDTWKGTNVTFTAEEAGEYVLKAAEGEENAVVFMETGFGSEMIELPYTFTLAAGESVAWSVLTGNYEVDTIDLVIEKASVKEPVEDKVNISVDETNDLTIGAGYFVTNENVLTLKGEYTFDWNVFVSDETTEDLNDTVAVEDSFITVLVNDEEIESGAKITYSEDTVVTIVIKSSDNTQNVFVSFTVTKTPETVQPDKEWTNNY